MVDGVKGLGGVKEETEALSVRLDAFEEEVVNGTGMVGSALAPQKALLTWFDEVHHARHNKGSNGGGQEPVIGVRDADGTGVRDKPRGFFWDEEEDSVVEARGGENHPRPGAGGQPGGEEQPSQRPRARQRRGCHRGQRQSC